VQLITAKIALQLIVVQGAVVFETLMLFLLGLCFLFLPLVGVQGGNKDRRKVIVVLALTPQT
jgi:hypothetical protein